MTGYRLHKTTDIDLSRRVFAEIVPGDVWPGVDGSIYWLMRNPSGMACGITIAHDCGYRTLYGSFRGLKATCRGIGLDRRLIAARERYAKSHGFEYVITYALATNGPSIKGLLNAGYLIYDPANPWADGAVYVYKQIK